MSRKKVFGIDGNTALLVGGGVGVLALVYFMTRPTPQPVTVVRQQQPSGNSTATTLAEIAAGGTILNSLIDTIQSANVGDTTS